MHKFGKTESCKSFYHYKLTKHTSMATKAINHPNVLKINEVVAKHSFSYWYILS